MKIKTPALILTVIISLLLSACSTLKSASAETGLTASGFIAADTIRVAPEIGGKVVSIAVAEGDSLQAGDVLFNLDDEVLLAQVKQAQAAVDLANVSLDAANAQLATTQAQYDVVVQQARLADQQNRANSWTTTSLQVSDLPVWYYQKSELLTAVEVEVQVANQELETEQANLDHELKNASNGDFVAAENRLAQAQAAYTSADRTLEQAKAASDNTALVSAAQEQLDADKAELDASKLEYERMLSSSAADAVLETRARLSVVQARRDQAMDMLTALQTGGDTLQVKAARAAVSQAETAVAQAKANQAQAQAALELVQLQQPRMVIKAPAKGVVLSLNIKAGELVSAGVVALTLGRLDEVNLTVYVPEDKYGQVSLGQSVSIAVDSIPNRKFSGTVQYISDEAEFTPRNVQTVEGRQSTVYAVKIRVPNSDLALKPGMPADVDFNIP
jgi:HlyD family secretion protein